MSRCFSSCSLVFFISHDPATTDTYTLSLHDALPISVGARARLAGSDRDRRRRCPRRSTIDKKPHQGDPQDRKSTRLNSSHRCISYAVFCLKKKKKKKHKHHPEPQTATCKARYTTQSK